MGRSKMTTKSKKVSPKKVKDEEVQDEIEVTEPNGSSEEEEPEALADLSDVDIDDDDDVAKSGDEDEEDEKPVAKKKELPKRTDTTSKPKMAAAAAKRTGRPVRENVTKKVKKDESDEEDGDGYEVEKISGVKFGKNKPSYLIKWKGYAETSWEPEANLKNSMTLLREFKAKLRKV